MSLFIFILIILCASILQTSTGFGFSIMATPFLLLLFDPREAIQLNLILSLFISSMLIVNIRRDVNWGGFERFVIGGLFGLPFGLTILLLLDITLLRLEVSVRSI